MAHNLEQKTMENGEVRTSFVGNVRNGLPWHKLGQTFDGYMTVAEALHLSGADYQVEMKDLFAATNPIATAMGSGSVSTDTMLDGHITSHKAIVRADNNAILGIVGNRYTPVQNVDAFKFVDALCSGKDMNRTDTPVIDSAGVLGIGERIFVGAKFHNTFTLGKTKEDEIGMYVVITTSHDGRGAIQALITPVRVCCHNTLALALATAKNKLYFRHTAGVTQKMDLFQSENLKEASQVLGLYDTYKEELEARLNHLKDIRLAERDLERIMAQVLLSEDNFKVYQETNNIFSDGISKQAQTLFTNVRDNIESGVGQDVEYKGTGMWLLNGFTTYFQNAKDYKKGGEQRKFDGLLQGEENRQMQLVNDLVLQYA